MSLNGINVYRQNVEKLMASEAWKRADDAERLRLAEMLVRSKYGSPVFGRVEPLPVPRSAQ